MIVSAEELATALDTHVDFARAVLERVRAIQRREPYLPPLPARELAERANRLRKPIPAFLKRKGDDGYDDDYDDDYK